jgi:riboflavin synthase
MFTGIIEELGTVREVVGHRLTVGCRTVLADTAVGSSIAVSGVCLTVVERTESSLAFDVTDETLERSSLGGLRAGDGVNLERPVSLAARLGGHLVQGHVDGVGTIASSEPDGNGGLALRIDMSTQVRRYVVEKGSLAVDGVSLTVAALHDDGVTIAVIPHTRQVTTLGSVRHGDPVNIEADLLAKYVERLMEGAGA